MNIPKVLIGDMFESSAKTLVNTVNCVGIMGKGIAQEFKKRYPEIFDQYKKECEKGEIVPGIPRFYNNLFNHSVINFPTKKHWKSPSLLKDIEKGLDVFLEKYKEWGVESIAFPPLGCGNGGLSWDIVGPLMYQKLSQADIPIEIYAPFGTPAEQLKEGFLANKKTLQTKKGRFLKGKIAAGDLIALEVLYRLGRQKYTKPVGRVIFQKICYILTELSIDTNLSFSKGSYGPFSKDLKNILHTFANANLTQEIQDGPMMRLEVGKSYESFKKEFLEYVNKKEPEISRTVDLFSRIKDTNQAEEVTTVIYGVRDLKKQKQKVSEKEVVDYVVKWKKSWGDEKKKTSIVETIRNLTALGWISVA